MSERFTQDYKKASKLIEGFSSFFEKIVYFSKDPDQNRQKLWDFKKDMTFNIHSRATIEEVYSDLLKDRARSTAQTSSLSTQDTSPKSTKTSNIKENDKQFEKKEITKPQATKEERINQVEDAEIPPIVSNRDIPDKTNPSPLLCSQFGAFEDFLIQIKAAIHIDSSKIFALSPSFTGSRSFTQSQESVFYAFCFAFFERYVQNKVEQPRLSLFQNLRTKLKNVDGDIETLSNYLDNIITPLTKGSGGEEAVQKFYEALNTNSSLYNSCILLFRRILLKILENKGLDSGYRKNTFRWMNDFSTSEQAFYAALAELCDANIRVFVLNFSKLVEKNYGSAPTPQPLSFLGSANPSKKELSLFHDKSSNYTYILYPSKDDPAPDSSRNVGNSPSRRSKQRSLSPNIRHEPKFPEGIHITPLTVRNEDKRSFIPFHENQENQENKEANIQDPPTLGITRNNKKAMTIGAGTTNPFAPTTPTNLYSRPIETVATAHHKTKSESNSGDSGEKREKGAKEGIVKTEIVGLNKARATSPLYVEKNREIGGNIGETMSQEKDSGQKGNADYGNFKDTASLVDKIMDEINQKVKTGKFDKEQFQPTINQDPLSENNVKELKSKLEKVEHDFIVANQKMQNVEEALKLDENHVKFKSEKTPKMEEALKLDENQVKFKSEKFGSDLSPVNAKTLKAADLNLPKPMALPIFLKAKFGTVNKGINQKSQEYDQITVIHLKDEDSRKNKSSELKLKEDLVSLYQKIMRKSGDVSNGYRPSMGTTLTMDS